MAEKQKIGKIKKQNNQEDDSLRSDYIDSLEMSVKFLKKEIDNLRSALDESNALPKSANTRIEKIQVSWFANCSKKIELINLVHGLLVKNYSVLESNIYLFSNDKQLIPVTETETQAGLNNQVENLEEEGIIDWALETGRINVIPNLNETMNMQTFFIIAPLKARNIIIGFLIANTIMESNLFAENDFNWLSELSDLSAIAIDSIMNGDRISLLNKELFNVNAQLLLSSGIMSVGEIAESISKEFENPIKVIKANLELINSGLGDSSRRLEIINDNIDRINNLNHKFKSLSEINTEQFEKIELNKLIKEVLDISAFQMKQDDILVELESDESDKFIYGNKARFEHVILNLILNSKIGMPDGGKLSIGIYNLNDRKITISLKDTGNGFSDEQLHSIFEPFYSDESINARTKLGMYLAKNIIEQHKGKISVFSEIGKGTTYKITLPIMK